MLQVSYAKKTINYKSCQYTLNISFIYKKAHCHKTNSFLFQTRIYSGRRAKTANTIKSQQHSSQSDFFRVSVTGYQRNE